MNQLQWQCSGFISAEMTRLYEQLIPYLEKGTFILDSGCGSGRYTLAFKRLGYRVHAIYASQELARFAEELIGQSIEGTMFQGFELKDTSEIVWACGSLLNVPFEDLLLLSSPKLASKCTTFYSNMKPVE